MYADTPPLAHRIPDACRRLGLGRTALYALIAAKELKAIKLGGRTVIPESELQRFSACKLDAVQ